ncbi:G2 mitotic-specific cyclin cdc13 [Brachionus plicatilis]|uniref:G2 mitotic-specific cyclin cdc13 n=1 Tax=Brachionus plicatilis TaxID=10195 RepID=A0A3M7PDB0_BRAPC|nr:G2 mitotic-specific cyclin cdc13 [Brachionus plicatilis]
MVFQPIYLLPNWDIFLKSAKNISETVTFDYICSLGRVLWGSWIYTRNNSHEKFKSIDYSELYSAIASKLIGGEHLNKVLSIADCLAILSSRIGIVKPKLISTCQKLVAKNMAVCTYVDTETGRFEIDYPSEPILAEAGAFLMHKSDNLNLIIKQLSFTIESSLIDRGDRGEMIAKLILIIAKDKARNSSQLFHPLMYHNLSKVGEFIQSLFGKCLDNCGNIINGWKCKSENEKCAIKIINLQIENYTELLDGWINFNHFSRSKYWLKEIDLVNGLKRCAAIHCKEYQTAVDLIIPIALDKSNFESISCIMVQVKLENQASEPKYFQVFNKINSKLINGIDLKKPSLLLYMQLGAPKQS